MRISGRRRLPPGPSRAGGWYRTLLPVLFVAGLVGGGEGALSQVNWTKFAGNPLPLNGPPGSWNRNVHTSSILYNADSSRFEMWFTAEVYNGPPLKIGFAWSRNGIDWTVHPDPVLTPTPGSWDASSVEWPSVIYERGAYKMWYIGFSQFPYYALGYATSPNGINWSKDTLHNPILGAGPQQWESGGTSGVHVMSAGGGYKMWYEGYQVNPPYNSKIGYATSVDGIRWVRDTSHNPVVDWGLSGQWDDAYVFMPCVLFRDGLYYMYYGGSRAGLNSRQIGLATSSTGASGWTKDPRNPVLAPTPGGWDGQFVQLSEVLMVGDSLYMWYTGTRDPLTTYLWRIGLAKCRIATSVEDLPGSAPADFDLMQNYPNPFNPVTTIGYQLASSGYVSLRVYDILGREVAVLVDGVEEAGYRSVTFDASSFASGVYLYRLSAGEFTQTRKLAVVR